jgi:hypothetical protein
VQRLLLAVYSRWDPPPPSNIRPSWLRVCTLDRGEWMLTLKADDTVVSMRTEPVQDSAEHACTRNIAERKAWATVGVIAVCANDRVSSRTRRRCR